jgi:hypothetical protein
MNGPNMENSDKIEFHFRDIRLNVYLGKTSDHYAGWIGKIHSKPRYAGTITRRTDIVGGKILKRFFRAIS